MLALGRPARNELNLQTTLTPGQITKSTQLHAGIFRLTESLKVTGSNLVLDGNGATLVGPAGRPVISISNTQNITIKNLHVKGGRWGIDAEGVSGLKLIDVDASTNEDVPMLPTAGPDPAKAGTVEPDYGGGIRLRQEKGATLQRVTANGEWNGLTLIDSTKVIVDECDFSHNSGTGIALWNSSDNQVSNSTINYVGRQPPGELNRLTTPSAILLEHDSNRNRFQGSSAVHSGGNGVFIRSMETESAPGADAAKYELPAGQVTPFLRATHPSWDNLFDHVDASFAHLAAVEFDFGSGNRFLSGVAAYSDVGLRFRFTQKCQVRGNEIVGNRTTGLVLDNGWTSDVSANTFVRDYGSPRAIACSDAETPPGGPVQNRNGDMRIYDNGFVGFAQALRFENSFPATVEGNRFYGASAVRPEDISDVAGPSPLFLNNTAEHHEGPTGGTSIGNGAILPGLLDPLGGIGVGAYASKTTEGIIQGSLTGRFAGEEYEIGRVEGGPPASLQFPPRVAPFVRVVGAAPTPNSFIVQIGDVSIARHGVTEASSGGETSDNPVSGDWDTPGNAWQPNDQPRQWWQVDLGRRITIDSIAIEAGVSAPNAFWGKFHVVVSDTGDFSGEEKTVGAETDWSHRPGPVRIYRFAPVRARFVRLVADEAKADVQMQQFAVYAALS